MPHRIPERVRSRREEIGLSQAELADATSLAPSTIARIENGDQLKITVPTLYLLCRELRCSADELIGLKHAGEQPDSPVRVVQSAILHIQDHDGGVVDRVGTPRVRCCPDCNKLLIPGHSHTREHCYRYLFAHGTGVQEIAGRFGASVDVVAEAVRERDAVSR